MWIILAVLSALFLGFYDVCKKRSLDGNSVVGVMSCGRSDRFNLFASRVTIRVLPERFYKNINRLNRLYLTSPPRALKSFPLRIICN